MRLMLTSGGILAYSPFLTTATSGPSRVQHSASDSRHVVAHKLHARAALQKRTFEYYNDFNTLSQSLQPHTDQIRAQTSYLKTCPSAERHAVASTIHQYIDTCRQIVSECSSRYNPPPFVPAPPKTSAVYKPPVISPVTSPSICVRVNFLDYLFFRSNV